MTAAGSSNKPWQTISEFTLPSEPGADRVAMERVAEAVRQLRISPKRLERLKTAVAEATLNALEHGHHYRAELPVAICVRASENAISVGITDVGETDLARPSTQPDLEAKIEGRQSPRGWGFFLIERLVDEIQLSNSGPHHTIELFLYMEGD